MKLRFPIGAVVLLILASLHTASVRAAGGSAEAPFRYYSVLDGLTQSEVYDIEQDRAGYLWLTTARGLNRYDGREFDQYTIADGLPTNTLTALHVDSNNIVWVGDARGGISILHGARVVHDIAPMLDGGAPITDIESVGERVFAVLEGVGIVEVIAQGDVGFEPVLGSESIGATNIAVSGDEVWVASSNGLYRLHLENEPHLESLDKTVRRITIDTAGTLWVVDADTKVGIWSNGVFDVLAHIEAENDIVSIVTDGDGLVWVASKNELFSFDGNGHVLEYIGADVRKYSGVDGVSSLFVDHENSLWLSSSSRLIRFLGDRFRHYRLGAGIDSESVWSIAEDRHGRMWFGTQTKLLLRNKDESLTVVGAEQGIPEGPVRDLAIGENGRLWVGIQGQGLVQFDVDAMTGVRIKGTDGMEVFDIDVAVDGAIWFSTLKSGVLRLSPEDHDMTRFETPKQTSAYTLDTGPDGSVWYGAENVGLVHLVPNGKGDYEQQIELGEIVLHNWFFDQVRLLDESSAWVATEEGGLYLFEEGKFVNYGEATPLDDQTVYLVEPLDNGTVVVGGEQGLYQFIPGESGLAHFNQQAGFIGLETNVHATFIDSENYLWVGTVDGATRMDISRAMPTVIEPTPTIVRMESELDRQPILDGQQMDPQQQGAHMEYAAISLLSPRGMEYSYKLDGVDTDWSPETTSRRVSYPRIPPGSYEFMVRARYPGGEWSQDNASRRFTVLPFFWQKSWFVGLAIVAVLLMFRTAMVYRTRHIEWLNDTLRAQVEERTQSIETARLKLLLSHEKLSKEIEARAEVETRFRRAFENAPIGMGLLDIDGRLFDANPALKNMFWAEAEALPMVSFADVLNDDDRERFAAQYRKLTGLELDRLDEKLACGSASGEKLQTVVNLSTVLSDAGEFLYSVLQIQDVTESLKLTVQLEYQASYDELTGLLNRRAFETELNRAWELGERRDVQSYLMFMDLDQFKVVNDTSGHTAGDQLLRAISEILLDSVRANDIVARLGGDEFGIILWDCPTDVAKRIAEAIRASIEEYRFHWDAETYRIGVSIGGLPIDRQIGDLSELQQLADAACYAAKEAGRNRVHMVEGDKDSARVHRGQVRWVQRLREAMNNNRFAIYGQRIQPLDNTVDEHERLEILLRLRDPETRRLIPPGAFLPAAERYGLSVELDMWVVDSLLNMLFVHQAFQAEHRTYWINLSGASIGDNRFAAFLIDAIERSPLPPGTINFEITETAVIRSIADAGNLMSALKDKGCQFALDDFGSGLSSFGYLKKLPVDFLKIDGMFIRDLLRDKTDRIFVKSIIDIAHTLNIKTIAEFVENDELLQVVRKLGADYAQGFAISRPFVLAPQFPQIAGSANEPVIIQTKAG